MREDDQRPELDRLRGAVAPRGDERTIDATTIARIVSQVTEPVIGVSFVPASPGGAVVGAGWKTAALPIDGGTPLMVAVSADAACARFLGCRMFSMAAEDLDDDMENDALCELVNMTAGLLKSAWHVDQPLGLPSMRHPDLLSATDAWSPHFLRAGELNLVLAVATRIL